MDRIRHLLGTTTLVLTIAGAYAAAQLGAILVAGPVAPPVPTIESHIREAARRYDVSEDLVVAVIEVESQFNPRAVSHRGAQGLMQLMPATAASLGVHDVFDPHDNIRGGVQHLRWLLERFDHDVPTALAAYNAGEGAVLRHGRRAPSRETREYVRRVLERMSRNQST
jgi:soluble lytic murein transglycosylase-like protein